MSDEEPDAREPAAPRPCPACGAATTADDRFCGQCGAALPVAGASSADPVASPAGASQPLAATSRQPGGEEREGSLWVLAARPAAVMGGGALLLLLAAALLIIGQVDDTGTIVMLAICLAPLALLVTGIGIARLAGRGREKADS